MNIRLGIDVGNGYTKYNGGNFASKVKNGSISGIGTKRKGVHQVEYKGKQYMVGTGSTFTGKDRYFTEEYEMCLLTGIALSTGKKRKTTINCENVVVGLPIDYYKNLSGKVESYLNGLGVNEIVVDGVHFTIGIESVTVFIEGAYPIATADDRHMITIDVGAGTINVIEWENQAIINKFTFDKAFYEVHKQIAEFLNENYNLGLTPADAERYVGATEVDTEDGVEQVPELDEIVGKFISEVATVIENSFHTKTCKEIPVFGGGAKDTFKFWQKHFKKAVFIEDAQHVNQRVYQAVADSIGEE